MEVLILAPKNPAKPSKNTISKKAPKDAARLFLEHYYPIHYKAGIGVEDALRGGLLGRHQVAILWLIHSEGRQRKTMNRKAIEQSLSTWFEISGAAITKALRSMAQAPLALVTLVEDPASGREKIVSLTPKGESHLKRMIAQGTAYVQKIIDPMSDDEITKGLHFFERIGSIVDDIK